MTRTTELTGIELTILDQLQRDARLSSAEIAPLLNISPSPTWRRIKRLEELGVISGYQAIVNARRVGFGVEAFVTLSFSVHDERVPQVVAAAAATVDEIVACYKVSGAGDYMMRVVARDMEAYANLITNVIGVLPFVSKVRSAFVLNEVKPYSGLPIRKAHGW